MEEQKKTELKRDLKEAIKKRTQLNTVAAENDAQKVIEMIVKIIEKLNLDERYSKESIPCIMVDRSNGEIQIESDQNLVDITGSLGKYSDETWKKVREFLNDTLGIQESRTSYMIPF